VKVGAVLVGIGLLLLLEQTTSWAGLEMGRLWPIIVIVMGAAKLVRGEGRDGVHVGSGLTLMMLGTILLLHTESVLSLWKSWPLLIVAHGARLLLAGRGRGGNGAAEVHDGQ
jgi:hypothetical protein